MARQNIPTQQNVKTLMYGDLMGVDYAKKVEQTVLF